MLAYIKGELAMKQTGYIVVDVGGLGYKIYMADSGIETIGNRGEKIKVYTYYRVKEDDIIIFGFKTNEELRMFELLIQVSGVGAKTAIAMLGTIEPSEFAIAVISEDISTLTKIPGIGAKSAKRIILELKDKLKKEQAISELENASNQNKASKIEKAIKSDNKISEAITALQVLGYNKKDIEKAIEKIDKDLSLEEIIKKGLILLAGEI